MKKPVRLSTASLIITIAVNLLFIAIACISVYTLISIVIIAIPTNTFGLYYMPMSIQLKDKALYVNSSLRCKRIPLDEVSTAEIARPDNYIRIAASGGFMGYCGVFNSHEYDKYTAYYGNPKECFILRMKDGKKIMLGCKDHAEMVDAINKQLKG